LVDSNLFAFDDAFSGLVVESLLGKDWTSNASSDLSPLMRSTSLTYLDFLVN